MPRDVRSPYACLVLLMTIWLSVVSCWTVGYAAAPPPLGQKDLAVWRPAAGTWYALNSATGTATVTPWGVSGDIPVPGDYDGDERTDLAVWRPAEGKWYILHSAIGTATVIPWGLPGDSPVPLAVDVDDAHRVIIPVPPARSRAN